MLDSIWICWGTLPGKGTTDPIQEYEIYSLSKSFWAPCLFPRRRTSLLVEIPMIIALSNLRSRPMPPKLISNVDELRRSWPAHLCVLLNVEPCFSFARLHREENIGGDCQPEYADQHGFPIVHIQIEDDDQGEHEVYHRYDDQIEPYWAPPEKAAHADNEIDHGDNESRQR